MQIREITNIDSNEERETLLRTLTNADREIFGAKGVGLEGFRASLSNDFDSIFIAVDTIESKENAHNSKLSMEIPGFALLRHLDDGELLYIGVRKEYRRKHIGTLLMDKLIEKSKDLRLGSIFLEVRESNLAAIGLYKLCGFREYRRRERYYTDPKEDAILMRYIC